MVSAADATSAVANTTNRARVTMSDTSKGARSWPDLALLPACFRIGVSCWKESRVNPPGSGGLTLYEMALLLRPRLRRRSHLGCTLRGAYITRHLVLIHLVDHELVKSLRAAHR